jgi:hypothetical protein
MDVLEGKSFLIKDDISDLFLTFSPSSKSQMMHTCQSGIINSFLKTIHKNKI